MGAGSLRWGSEQDPGLTGQYYTQMGHHEAIFKKPTVFPKQCLNAGCGEGLAQETEALVSRGF